jgi:hypothetical protein
VTNVGGSAPAASAPVAPSGKPAVAPSLTFGLADVPGSVRLDSKHQGLFTISGKPGTGGQAKLITANAVTSKKKKAKKKVLTLATANFKIPASGKAKVILKVKGKGFRVLKKAKRLPVVLQVNGGTAKKSLTLKAPKAKKKHKKG